MKNKNSFILYGVIIIIAYLVLTNITVNITPSIQQGIYLRYSVNTKNLKKGDVILAKIPLINDIMRYSNDKELEKENVIKNGYIKVIKQIAGVRGDVIHIKGNRIFINDEDYGVIYNTKTSDNVKKMFSKYDNYTLKEDEYIALGKRNGNLDGRYYGVMNVNDVKIYGKYTLIFTDKRDSGFCFENTKINSNYCKLARKFGKNPFLENKE